MSNKEATIYLLDVSEPMTSCLDEARKVISRMLHYKMVANKKNDHVCLILAGTQETLNNLAEDDQYQNITVKQELSSTTELSLINFIEHVDFDGGHEADIIDALIIALDQMAQVCKMLKYEKRIYILTNGISKMNLEDLDLIQEKVMQMGIALILIDFSSLSKDKSVPSFSSSSSSVASQIQSLKQLVLNVEGNVFTHHEAAELLYQLRSKNVKPTTTFRGFLYLGSSEEFPKRSLCISVWAYNKTSAFKITAPKKWSTLSDKLLGNSENITHLNDPYRPITHEVTMNRTYITVPENQDEGENFDNDEYNKNARVMEEKELDETEKSSLIKAYRYGKTFVPFSTEDEEAFKFLSEKSMMVVGFVKQARTERWWTNSHVMAVHPDPSSNASACVFSALFFHALLERKTYALVRYCRINDAAPRLGVLVPKAGNKEYCLWIPVPFAEDLSIPDLPSLKRFVNPVVGPPSNDKGRIKGKHPHERRKMSAKIIQNQMKSFIQSMDLSQQPLSDGELFSVKDVFHVGFQRLYECVAYRAIHGDDAPLPEPDPIFTLKMTLDPIIADHSRSIAQELKSLFYIENNIDEGTNKRKKPLKDLLQGAGIIGTKQFSLDQADLLSRSLELAASQSQHYGSLGYMESRFNLAYNDQLTSDEIHSIRKVSMETPLRDFKVMVSNREEDLIELAVRQMIEIIQELIEQKKSHSKALSCLLELRQVALEEDEVKQFNDLLRTLKEKANSATIENEGVEIFFYSVIQLHKIGLISIKESKNGADESEVNAVK